MSLADYAAQHGLTRVGARPPLPAYLREAWHRRAFVYLLARYRVAAANQRNRLGMAWVILTPIINAVVYGTIFGFILGGNRPPRFIEFLLVGVFFFDFFGSTFSSGAKAITGSQSLVQSLSFPRIVLPVARVLEELLQFLPTLGVLFLFVLAAGNTPHWSWLLIVPLVALYTAFNLGLSLITARLAVHVRDLTELLPFVTRLLFFSTGIFFDIEEAAAGHPVVQKIIDLQPIHEFLSLARGILLDGEFTVRTEYWLYASVWSIALLVIGTVFFWQAEERYGRDD